MLVYTLCQSAHIILAGFESGFTQQAANELQALKAVIMQH